MLIPMKKLVLSKENFWAFIKLNFCLNFFQNFFFFGKNSYLKERFLKISNSKQRNSNNKN